MHVDTKFRGSERSDALVAHVERRAKFALGRFQARVQRLLVRVDTTQGPGESELICSVEAHGDFGTRRAEARGGDAYAVSLRALEMLERSVARALKHGPSTGAESSAARGSRR